VLFGVASPLVIVYSASMEPNLYRGDIIGLTKQNNEMIFGEEVILDKSIKNILVENYVTPKFVDGNYSSLVFFNGQEVNYSVNSRIVVYNSFPTNIPIIHRAIVKIKAKDGEFIGTIGEFNNNVIKDLKLPYKITYNIDGYFFMKMKFVTECNGVIKFRGIESKKGKFYGHYQYAVDDLIKGLRLKKIKELRKCTY
jgi:signal peptidase I